MCVWAGGREVWAGGLEVWNVVGSGGLVCVGSPIHLCISRKGSQHFDSDLVRQLKKVDFFLQWQWG